MLRNDERSIARLVISNRCPESWEGQEVSRVSTTLLTTIETGLTRKEWGCCWKGVAVVVVVVAVVVVVEAG